MSPLQNFTEPSANVDTIVIPPEEIFVNCYESDGFVKFQYTVDDLLLAASTAATVFNFLVVFCAFKLFKRSGDTMHLFIINMTLGDLVLTVFSLPNEFLIRKHTFLRHIHLCALIHFFNWLGLAVSGLSLTLLNVDKLIYFRWPMRYDQTMSKRRAAVLCFFIWGISFGFVSYVWIFDIVYATSDCMLQMRDVKKYYYEIFMIMFCVLPVTSSLFLSTYLFRLTRQKRHAPARSNGAQVDIRTFNKKVRSLVFIFATTAWTSFSLLPYRIFNICRIHLFDWNSIECEQRVIMNWLAWLLIYLLTLNPIVNPLITSIIYAPYRMTLKKLLINIPIGNRLQYTYRGDTTETSYLSVRRGRVRCEATSGILSNELSRLNGGELQTRKSVCGAETKSAHIARPLSPNFSATLLNGDDITQRRASSQNYINIRDRKCSSREHFINDNANEIKLNQTLKSSENINHCEASAENDFVEIEKASFNDMIESENMNGSLLLSRHKQTERRNAMTDKLLGTQISNNNSSHPSQYVTVKDEITMEGEMDEKSEPFESYFFNINTYIDDSASSGVLSPSPERYKKMTISWPLDDRVSPKANATLPAAANWCDEYDKEKARKGELTRPTEIEKKLRKKHKIFANTKFF